MALPTSYLTSTKNLEGIFNAIQSAKAPAKFTQRFLEDLGFKSTTDRLVINMLKALGFLSADGSPTARYFEFLDQSQSARVLAEGIEHAYADLFQLRRDAHHMDRAELRGKIKTLTQGTVSDDVVNKMAGTFLALAALADFDAPSATLATPTPESPARDVVDGSAPATGGAPPFPVRGVGFGGLVYNIAIHLPESRDPAVYDALFRSLKTHLLA